MSDTSKYFSSFTVKPIKEVDDCNVLEVKFTNTSTMKATFSILKEFVNNVPIIFTKSEIQIKTFDQIIKNLMIDVNIEGAKLDGYKCIYEQIYVMLDMKFLCSLFSSSVADDILRIYIKNSNYNTGNVDKINIEFIKKDNKQKTEYELICSIPDHTRFTSGGRIDILSPTMKYNNCEDIIRNNTFRISMEYSDFQDIIKDINNICSVGSGGTQTPTRITITKNKITFVSSKVVNGTQTIERLIQPDKIIYDDKNAAVIIERNYNIRGLTHMSKLGNNCNSVELIFGDNLPLLLKYSMGSIGHIYIVLNFSG